MSTSYCLRVVRLEGLKWKRRFYSRHPNLYAKVTLGDTTRRTVAIKRDKSPSWNEPLDFICSSSPDDSMAFDIQVEHKSLLLPNPIVGVAQVNLADLLSRSSDGEVAFCIYAPTRVATPTGSIFLRLVTVDAINAVDNRIGEAVENVQKSGLAPSAEANDLLEVVEPQLNRHDDLYEAIGVLLERLDTFHKCMDTLSEIHPFITIAWSLTSALYSAVQNVFETDRKVIDLVRTMSDAFEFVRDIQTLRDKVSSLQRSIDGLLKQTIECCLFIRNYTSRSFLGRMFDIGSSQKIDEFDLALVKLKSEIDSGVNIYTAFISTRTVQGVDNLMLEKMLDPSPVVAFYRPNCLPGTRLEIRRDIIEWIFSETKQNILWLHGVAGSGKSTISTTIAHHLRQMSRLGAFLFFERGKSEPAIVMRTIAHQLALFDSTIASSLLSALGSDKIPIATASPLHQFNKLLLQPLRAATEADLGPVVIVLDALDECGTPESRRELVKLLQQEFSKLPNNFRFLITSRREADIDNFLSSQPEAICAMELDYTSATSHEDVLSFLHFEMRNAIGEHLMIPTEWKWDENMALLGKTAAGLFIWASTAVKMVKNSNTRFRRLERLVSDSRSLSEFGLDELYATVLRDSDIKWHDKDSRDLFVRSLSLLLLSKVPISSDDIDGILGLAPSESSLQILSNLRSILTYSPGGPVSLFHASFSDYLMSPKRSHDPWFIDIPAAKHLIAMRCFLVMENLLRFNICDLESSFVRNDDVPDLSDRVASRIPPHLKYTCIHWTQHLVDAQYSDELLETLSQFAYNRLLFWFEVLSLVKAFSRVTNRALFAAGAWIESHDGGIAYFLRDAGKLASMFTSAIVQSTPHIYVSMVPLLQGDSKVADYYSKYMSSLIRLERRGVRRPPLCLKALRGHTRAVKAVAFSPDGKHVASASRDCTIRLWDVDSGEQIFMPLGTHSGHVTSVCFSPDGKRIVSGSMKKLLRIWDVQNGDLILGPLVEHTREVLSVAWSPDGTRIASGSSDKTIILWDATIGKVIHRIVTGQTTRVSSVAFSPDSLLLASGFEGEDHAIRIWNVKSGKRAFRRFKGHSRDVESVAFSPNGKHLVSGSTDETVKIWEVESGSVISTLKGHKDRVTSVAYSPCGTRIVSCSWDNSVMVWDVKSGRIVSGPLGHSDGVDSVAYSPDGKYIASGSFDNTVRIWDTTAAIVSPRPYTTHKRGAMVLAVSPDGTRIASASDDLSIVIWDAQSGEIIVGPLRSHVRQVTSVTFTSDGSRVISASLDNEISIWNAETGESISHPLGLVRFDRIAVSRDGRTVACGSSCDIKVWSIETGQIVAEPDNHSKKVSSLAYSPDGERLAAASRYENGNIIIWNADSWEVITELVCEITCGFLYVCFSPDGSRIASRAVDHSIIIWDAESGQKIAGLFARCTADIDDFIFSLDGRHVISCTVLVPIGMIRVWNVESGQVICKVECSSLSSLCLALHPDGSRIISGHRGNTIRLWDFRDVLQPSSEHATDITLPSIYDTEDDGWSLGGSDRCNLLLWIPPDLRTILRPSRNILTFSCESSTGIDFTGAALGERWAECFTGTRLRD